MSTGLANPGEQLRAALHVVNRSRSLAAEDEREHVEVLLARGRVLTVLPAGMPGRDEGVANLEEVLVCTAGGDGDGSLDIPGTAALHRVHALYYLGVSALDAQRRDQAARWLAECITIDPASRFAELSYELLGTLGG